MKNLYKVSVIETLKTEVTVNAESKEEAEKIVKDRYKSCEIVLDAENFIKPKFTTTLIFDAKGKVEKLARAVYKMCLRHDAWGGVRIYFNGKLWTSEYVVDGKQGKYIDTLLFEYDGYDPKDYFEYVRDENILSMSFEGALYEIINEHDIDFLQGTFRKLGFYYELGNAWNLTAYPLTKEMEAIYV